MKSLDSKLEELILQIESFLNDELSTDELEQSTMAVISHEDFDTLDSSLQDLVYQLDNKELEELTKQEVSSIRDDLKAWLKAS